MAPPTSRAQSPTARSRGRAVEQRLNALGAERLDALEIAAGWKWRQRRWASYTEMNWSQYDICEHVLDRQFDVIIADNVWEHLLYPARATRHVLPMLRTGGMFINITPFLIRRHLVPTDCTRWTEMGMRYFLEDCGFDPAAVHTGSWGNRAAVRAISTGPALAGGAGCRKRGTFRSPSGPSRASRNERVGTHRDHRPRA